MEGQGINYLHAVRRNGNNINNCAKVFAAHKLSFFISA